MICSLVLNLLLLRKPNFNDREHKSLNKLNPIHVFTPNFFLCVLILSSHAGVVLSLPKIFSLEAFDQYFVLIHISVRMTLQIVS